MTNPNHEVERFSVGGFSGRLGPDPEGLWVRYSGYEKDIEWWKKEARVWREAAEAHLADYEKLKEEVERLELAIEDRRVDLKEQKRASYKMLAGQREEIAQAKAQALADVREALIQPEFLQMLASFQHADLVQGFLDEALSTLEDTQGEGS